MKDLILQIFEDHNQGIDNLVVNFCDNDQILIINKTFLNHNYHTDTITFCYSEIQERVSGEVFISIETVKANSNYYNYTFSDEILRVLIHSVFHLCGYEDKTEEEIDLIRNLEDKYIKIFKESYVSRET